MIEIRRNARPPRGFPPDIIFPYVALAAGSCLLFAPAIRAYFFLDDYMWLRIARFDMASAAGWIHAFLASVGFGYRPLSQQVFFWFGWHLFGFQPLGYHVLSCAALVVAAAFAYRACLLLTSNRSAALIAAVTFAFSGVHFDSVAWASAFTEAGATAALCIAFYLFAAGRKIEPVVWYFVALACDETAAPLPMLAFLAAWILERDSFRESVKRCVPLAMALAAYALFRLFVTGLPVTHAGPYAVHASLGLDLTLLWNAVLEAAGIHPPFSNIYRLGGPPRALLLLCVTIAATIWSIALIRRVVEKQWEQPLRAFAFGAAWFVVALTPLMAFTANNWSVYNVGIPLVGLGYCIAAPFAGAMTPRWMRGAAICLALLLAVMDGISIYSPGGWAEIDGIVRGGNAGNILYGFAAQHDLKTTRINIVSPAAALPVAEHVSGFDYGVQAMSGDPTAHITYSTIPVPDADVVFAWDPSHFALEGPTVGHRLRSQVAASPFPAPRTLDYSFVTHFGSGRISSNAHVQTPTGKGAFLFAWRLGRTSVRSLTVLPGFRYAFGSVPVKSRNDVLRFQAGRPLSQGSPVLAFVDITARGDTRRIFSELLMPAEDSNISWHPVVVSLSRYAGQQIAVTFGAEVTSGAPDAAWAAFADPEVAVPLKAK